MTTRILAAHPSPDLYGADRMFLEAVAAFCDDGDEVVAVFPERGPLLPLVADLGVEARVVPFPVLRKALLSPAGLFGLVTASPRTLTALDRVIATTRPDVVYVNTVTIPHWVVAGRRRRLPVIGHVHEAEEGVARPIAWALTAPMLLVDLLVANSAATARFLRQCHPRLARTLTTVPNGFRLPDRVPSSPTNGKVRLVVVGRLSPRKGQDLAVAALAELVADGHDVELELVGTPFRGYEWFVDSLRRQAASQGVADRLHLPGFRSPGSDAFADGDIALVPSRIEPFGMVAVEAMAVGRPVVAARVGGLAEIIEDGVDGLLVPPGDAPALAAAVRRLLLAPADAEAMAARAAESSRHRFDRDRFRAELLAATRHLPAFARSA